MKTSWTLPTSGEAKVFFARYAKPVAILRNGSIFGQLISGATEGVVLYGLFYAAFISILSQYAADGAKVAALACVLVIEGASRVGLVYSIRAIVRKRWKGKDLVMTLFLVPMTLLFVSIGTLLSIYGAEDGIKMVSVPPAEKATTGIDSTATVRVEQVQKEWDEEKELVKAEVGPLVAATEDLNSANLKMIDREIRDVRNKERRENQSYSTQKGTLRTQRQEIETAGIAEVTGLKKGEAREMTKLREKYKPLMDTLRSGQFAAVQDVADQNKENFEEWEADLEGYSWFLGAIVIAFMLLMIVSITIDEVHKSGSEMVEQVQPGAFYFEDGILASLSTAIGGRLEAGLRNLVLWIERGTPETKEPVRPPLIWVREKNEIHSKKSEDGSTRKPASTKPMKWEEETASLYYTPTTKEETHEIEDKTKEASSEERVEERTKGEAREVVYTIKEKHLGMSISDLTQRLKDYKKRKGGHEQKAISQERKGKVSQRTKNAIENNEHWIGYFEAAIEATKVREL